VAAGYLRIDWLAGIGVNGLHPNGSTGEFIRLSLEERQRVIRIIAGARRIQLKLLDIINAMLCRMNFPEGFRAGMSLRGFNPGTI
jgi:dihydrodipicolinate synthase/N-acetylneuraminate lyase